MEKKTIRVNEIFGPTIQGEGKSLNTPVVFLRLATCNLACHWCDSIAEGTLIRTANKKWVPIEQVKVGEEILGVTNNKYVKAKTTHLVNHTETKAIEFTFSNGQKLTTTYNHLIYVKRKNSSSVNSTKNWKWQWVKAEKIKQNDIVWGIGKPITPIEQSQDFVEGWLAGYTAGDGGWTNGNKLKRRWETVTPEIQERLHQYLSRLNFSFISRTRKGNHTKNLIYQTDSVFVAINKDTKEWSRGFISGFYDAEGSNAGARIEFSNKEIKLLKQVQQLLQQFGYTSTIRLADKDCYRLIVPGTLSNRLEFDSFFDYIKPHDHSILFGKPGLRGARSKFKRSSKQFLTVIDIKKKKKKTRFFDIGSTSENFFANGVLVHNTPYTWNWVGTSYVHPDKFDPKKEIRMMSASDIVKEIVELASSEVHRVVVSGGEPMLQQKDLLEVFGMLKQLGYVIEVETNGTIEPTNEFLAMVDQINCSPKLASSGPDNTLERRIKPVALTKLAGSEKVYFKFVITSQDDLKEIEALLNTFNIKNEQVYLMPEGRTKEEQLAHQKLVYDLCMTYGYNFSPRLHILIHDTKRGV